MSERLTRYQSNMVRSGLEAALSLEVYEHPDSITNHPNFIHISDRQKSYYLNQLADRGIIARRWNDRGWYKYYTFKRLYKNGNDPVDAVGMTMGEIPF